MLAADEAELRHKLYIDRITGDDRRFLQDMQDKIMCIFRLLSVQMFLSLSAKAGSLSTEEKEVLGVMLQGSKKKDEIGFSDRHLIDEIVRAYLAVPSTLFTHRLRTGGSTASSTARASSSSGPLSRTLWTSSEGTIGLLQLLRRAAAATSPPSKLIPHTRIDIYQYTHDLACQATRDSRE